MCVGKATKKAVVVNDKIEIRDMCTSVMTIDHRFGDAALLLKCLNLMKDYIEDPKNFNINKYEDSKTWDEIERLRK